LSIEKDDHLFTVLQYVERNPLRASLIEQADARVGLVCAIWRTSSLVNGIDRGPVSGLSVGIEWVNQPLSAAELDQIGHSINRGTPTVQLVGVLVWRLSLV
jgi:hypothetical protein